MHVSVLSSDKLLPLVIGRESVNRTVGVIRFPLSFYRRGVLFTDAERAVNLLWLCRNFTLTWPRLGLVPESLRWGHGEAP